MKMDLACSSTAGPAGGQVLSRKRARGVRQAAQELSGSRYVRRRTSRSRILFRAGQLADAEARYKAVLKFPRCDVYWYANYSWLDPAQPRKHQQALETFFLRSRKRDEARRRRTCSEPRREEGTSCAPTRSAKADKAFRLFKRVDKKNAFTMLQTSPTSTSSRQERPRDLRAARAHENSRQGQERVPGH
jgi:hypothetical protein